MRTFFRLKIFPQFPKMIYKKMPLSYLENISVGRELQKKLK